MDKTAKRLKQKRRLERMNALREQQDNIVNSFRDKCRKNGMRVPGNKREILKAYRQVTVECLHKAMLINSVCTLCALRKLYGFGKVRLYRVAVEITVRIGNVGQAERKIGELAEELLLEVGLDCNSGWSEWEPSETKCNEHELKALLASIPHTLTIMMYAVYISLGYKKRRMKMIYDQTCEYIKYALVTDSTEPMTDELKKAGLNINERGQFFAAGNGINNEHDKYIKRTGGFENAKNGISNFSRVDR